MNSYYLINGESKTWDWEVHNAFLKYYQKVLKEIVLICDQQIIKEKEKKV